MEAKTELNVNEINAPICELDKMIKEFHQVPKEKQEETLNKMFELEENLRNKISSLVQVGSKISENKIISLDLAFASLELNLMSTTLGKLQKFCENVKFKMRQ